MELERVGADDYIQTGRGRMRNPRRQLPEQSAYAVEVAFPSPWFPVTVGRQSLPPDQIRCSEASAEASRHLIIKHLLFVLLFNYPLLAQSGMPYLTLFR